MARRTKRVKAKAAARKGGKKGKGKGAECLPKR
jgi:hypothetical protein